MFPGQERRAPKAFAQKRLGFSSDGYYNMLLAVVFFFDAQKIAHAL